MKLNKRFLILLLLLSILILGFNSVGAADLSGFSEGGTADLSIDDVSVSHQSIDSVSSSVESLNDADDDLSESISSQDDDLIIGNMDSLLVSNGAQMMKSSRIVRNVFMCLKMEMMPMTGQWKVLSELSQKL